MRFSGLIFDFDGVLVETEYAGNKHLAEYLTALGHPISPEEAMARFMGLSGRSFIQAIEERLGRPLPEDFYAARKVEDARVLAEGVPLVAGAKVFVEALPPELPRAIASSSSTAWIEAHLRHIRLLHAFRGRIFSGKEHVARGKPAPDIYLHAAAAIGVEIADAAIIEDSPVGIQGAVASGAFVIGLAAGNHCLDGHGDRLKALGAHAIAHSFEDVARLLA